MGLSKNQIIPLVITGTTAEGSGIGRAETGDESSGMAVIVPFTGLIKSFAIQGTPSFSGEKSSGIPIAFSSIFS